MFFYTNYTLMNILAAAGTMVVLLIINEITRRSKILSVGFYILLPLFLTVFVWRADAGSSTGTWFAWVKTYSALAGVIGFMAIRYIKKLQVNTIALLFPAFILSLNISEAVARDFQCYYLSLSAPGGQFFDGGLTIIGGPWNIMNGIAGILNIVTITGWLGIRIAKTKSEDMIWADQLWFWVLAYDLWNMAYCYNCLSNRSFYAGFVILIAATLAAIFIKKGAWLQHRAQTLAMWGMFSLTFAYSKTPYFNIAPTANHKALFLLSFIALVSNIILAVYVINRAVKAKHNPFTNEMFKDHKAYQDAISENNL
jgi:hypothetical protein